MADHVGIGIVHHDRVVSAARDCRDRGVGNFARAHRRREIVGRRPNDPKDQLAVLAAELFLAAAVKEIRTCAYFSVSASRS